MNEIEKPTILKVFNIDDIREDIVKIINLI